MSPAYRQQLALLVQRYDDGGLLAKRGLLFVQNYRLEPETQLAECNQTDDRKERVLAAAAFMTSSAKRESREKRKQKRKNPLSASRLYRAHRLGCHPTIQSECKQVNGNEQRLNRITIVAPYQKQVIVRWKID